MRLKISGALAALMMAAGCSGGSAGDGFAPDAPQPADAVPADSAPPQANDPARPPLPREGYDAVGYASWYGEELGGKPTAGGEPYNPGAISAAHRTLPLSSFAEVTALDSGRTILVRINDRGPFSGNRLIDLSRGAAQQLGVDRGGSIPVRVRAVTPPPADRAALLAGRPAAERIATPPGLLTALRKRLGSQPGQAATPAPPRPASRPVAAPGARPGASYAPPGATPRPSAAGAYQVQVAAFSSRDRAAALARRLNGRVVDAGSVYRVRLGPFTDQAAAARARDEAARQGYGDARIVRE